jgi:hypothetical protein
MSQEGACIPPWPLQERKERPDPMDDITRGHTKKYTRSIPVAARLTPRDEAVCGGQHYGGMAEAVGRPHSSSWCPRMCCARFAISWALRAISCACALVALAIFLRAAAVSSRGANSVRSRASNSAIRCSTSSRRTASCLIVSWVSRRSLRRARIVKKPEHPVLTAFTGPLSPVPRLDFPLAMPHTPRQ